MKHPFEIRIDAERCKKDGLCAHVCPSRIFTWEAKAAPTVSRADECVLCGQCLAICTSDAIQHSELALEHLRRIESAVPATPEALEAFLRQRRSVRVYKKREVPRDLLERVATMAGYAPVGAFGGDGWVRRVTVVSGEPAMQRVRELTVAYMRKLYKALDGVMIRTVAKFVDEAKGGLQTLPDVRMRLAEWDAGRDVVTYDAPAAVFISSTKTTPSPREDCDAALMCMMLTAHAHGLGTCWNGWLGHAAAGDHVSGFHALHEMLRLPADHGVVQAFTVGWPKLPLHSVPERRTSLTWVE